MSTIANLKINVLANTRSLTKGLKNARKKVITFKGAVTKLTKGLAMVGFAAAAIGAYAFAKALKSIITTFANFEHAMQEVRSILLDISDEAFQPMIDKAMELGATTVFTATEAAQAMSFLSRAGFDASETLATVGGTLDLAAAGNMELAEAANITSQVLRGMGLEVSETSRVADVLALTSAKTNTTVSQLGSAFGYVGPVASALGITLEETAAMLGQLSNAGIQADRAGTGLKNIFAELAAEIDANGISALKKFTEGGIGVAEAFEIFQKRGGPAILALEKMSDKTAQLTEDLNDAEGIAKEMARIRMESLVGQMELLRSKVETLKIEIGERLKPTISNLIESLSDITVAGTLAFDSMITGPNDAAVSVSKLNDILLTTASTTGWIITAFGQTGNFLQALWNVFQVLGAAVVGILMAIASTVAVIFAALDALFHWDSSRFTNVTDDIKFMFLGLTDWVDDQVAEGTEAGKFNSGLGKDIRDFVDLTKANLKNAGNDLKEPAAKLMDPAMQAMQDKLEGFKSDATEWETWIERYRNIIGGARGKRTSQQKADIEAEGGIENLRATYLQWVDELKVIKDNIVETQEAMKPKEPMKEDDYISPEFVEALQDASQDMHDFIAEAQFAMDTMHMSSRQKEIEAAWIAGVSENLIREAKAMDALLTQKEKDLEITKKLEDKAKDLKKELRGSKGEFEDRTKELQQMFGRGMINQFEFLEGLDIADKKLKKDTKKDSVDLMGIQTVLGTVKVGGFNQQQAIMNKQLSAQNKSNTHLKNINKKLQSSGGVII